MVNERRLYDMDMEKINIELESIDKKADLIYEEIKECLKESNDKNAIIHKEQSFEDKSDGRIERQ